MGSQSYKTGSISDPAIVGRPFVTLTDVLPLFLLAARHAEPDPSILRNAANGASSRDPQASPTPVVLVADGGTLEVDDDEVSTHPTCGSAGRAGEWPPPLERSMAEVAVTELLEAELLPTVLSGRRLTWTTCAAGGYVCVTVMGNTSRI